MNSVHKYWSTRIANCTQADYDAIYAFMVHHPVGVLEAIVKTYPTYTIGWEVAFDILTERASDLN